MYFTMTFKGDFNKMKKGLSCLALVGLVASMAACSGTSSSSNSDTTNSSTIKVGLITLHGDTSTYDKNFIDAFNAAANKVGVKAIVSTGVYETDAAYSAATTLVEGGCKFIFADSFGHESYILKAAKENKDVEFGHATGTMAHTEKVSNFHNAFASIYEGRYLAGVAAGLKLQSMIQADSTTSKVVGYVGAHPYAEVISGYTSWFLGVRSVVEDATMVVKYTNSWYDETAEKTVAEDLINNQHCSIISQHADSWGAPNACETAGVPNVTYNGSTESKCPNTYLISSKVNWEPYFEYAFNCVKEGKSMDTDYYGTLGDGLYDGSVALTEPGKKATVDGTEDQLKEVAKDLKDGKLKVFDTSKFTVKNAKASDTAGKITVDSNNHLTQYKADVNTDTNYTPDTDVVKTTNGITYFAESEYRSAPYFDIIIDGITELK